MKTFVAAVLISSMSLVMNTVVVAEPFTSRGQNYIAEQSNQDAGHSEITISDSGFTSQVNHGLIRDLVGGKQFPLST